MALDLLVTTAPGTNAKAGGDKINAMFTELFGRPHGLRNKLVNGCFRFWQRGTSSLLPNDNAYGPDRWRLLAEANGTATLARSIASLASLGTAKATLTVATANNKFGLFQVIEAAEVRALRGRKVALQAALKATAGIADVRMAILYWFGTGDAVSGDPVSSWNAAGSVPTLNTGWVYLNTPLNLSVGTSFAVKTVEATVDATANNLAVLIWSEDKTTTITTDVLEIGYADLQVVEGAEDLPAFEPVDFALELQRCQRFYEKSYNLDSAPGDVTSVGQRQFVMHASITAYLRHSIEFRARKRAAPTVLLYSPATGSNAHVRLNNTSDLSYGLNFTSETKTDIEITRAWSAGDFIWWHFAADAEL